VATECPLVSIVVPAHNAEDTLERCLEACLSQTYPRTEVIVVDDGSSDGTAEIAGRVDVRCLRQLQRGPAAARNHGAREAEGEFVAFTDADCVPAPDWIGQLMDGFEDGVAAVGGTYGIANEESLLARMIHEEIRARHDRFESEVDFLGSFNVVCRKEAFSEAGGFDEDFSAASAEDNDLAYRLAAAGWRLRFTPGATVAHYHPTRLWPYLNAQLRHGFWRVKLYAKHPVRASRGDRYAGLGDLAAPGLALVLLAMVLASPSVFAMPRWVLIAFMVCFVALSAFYAAIRLPMSVRMVRRTGDLRMFEFGDVAVLRDIARGLGMIRGVWTFLILRRATV